MSRIYIHADDFGLTSGINAHIFRAWEMGVLHSTSIIANGYAFEEAVSLYQQASFDIQVHLNFIEGKAMHPLSAGSFFCADDGYFNRSFFYLYSITALASTSQRVKMKEAVKNEMCLQIEKVKAVLKSGARLRVDSHQHIHMIPLFFESLTELINELKIDYIRIPYERISITHALRFYPHILTNGNLAKVVLLNRLSRKALSLLNNYSIKYSKWFIGVLHTGKMNLLNIKRSYEWIKPFLVDEDDVEILLHPGGALPEEKYYWEKYPSLKKYYLHPNRQYELRQMLQPEFSTWVQKISK